MLRLNNIEAQPGSVRRNKRVGRGEGSGHGGTAGKGHKGQKARSGGFDAFPGFEGGQNPIYRRLPKRGFKNVSTRSNFVINVGDLDHLDLDEISLSSLAKVKKLKGSYDRLTVLGVGELEKKVLVKAHKVSASAQEKIAKAGGTVEILSFPKHPKRELKKKKQKQGA